MEWIALHQPALPATKNDWLLKNLTGEEKESYFVDESTKRQLAGWPRLESVNNHVLPLSQRKWT